MLSLNSLITNLVDANFIRLWTHFRLAMALVQFSYSTFTPSLVRALGGEHGYQSSSDEISPSEEESPSENNGNVLVVGPRLALICTCCGGTKILWSPLKGNKFNTATVISDPP